MVFDFGWMGFYFGLIGSFKGGVVVEKNDRIFKKVKYGRFYLFVCEWYMLLLIILLLE